MSATMIVEKIEAMVAEDASIGRTRVLRTLQTEGVEISESQVRSLLKQIKSKATIEQEVSEPTIVEAQTEQKKEITPRVAKYKYRMPFEAEFVFQDETYTIKRSLHGPITVLNNEGEALKKLQPFLKQVLPAHGVVVVEKDNTHTMGRRLIKALSGLKVRVV